jgi:ABC-2 type transport system ATP-binding protein
MLDIREVTKRYKGATANALDSVSFAVPDNSITALLGPNGAGKSTLVGILSGTIQQDGGQVQIDGIPLSFKDRRILSRIGVVPQEIAFDFVFTTEEILSLEFGYFGLRKDPEWLAFLLERLSLKDKRNVPIRELSGGMKRRLMIAKALIHRPPCCSSTSRRRASTRASAMTCARS